jgi:hypothetical protein
MPGFFSRLKGRDGPSKVKKGAQQPAIDAAPPKPRWEDAWSRKSVEPQEVQELLHGCTVELKARGTNMIDIDSIPLSVLQEPTVCKTSVALHELISSSDSVGHSVPYPPIPTNVRSKRSAYIY